MKIRMKKKSPAQNSVCVFINKNECEKHKLPKTHTQYKRCEKKYNRNSGKRKTKIWKIRIKVKFFGRQRLWRHHQNRRTKRRDIFFYNIILFFSFHPAYTHERPESATVVIKGGKRAQTTSSSSSTKHNSYPILKYMN